MTGVGAALLECFTTFILVYTVHLAADPRASNYKKKASSLIGPLAIGLVGGSLVLATSSLTGGSMNPARSFGPAVISDNYGNQAAYWVGPFLGAALAVVVHPNLVYPIRDESDGNVGEDV
ncbi:hypothetical protein LUZ60_013250 [Juncus effusus]|nr:hypothetical protein LUZ60_013250 [Juncus effusus]